MKSFSFCAMMLMVLCGLLYISTTTAGLTKEEFIAQLKAVKAASVTPLSAEALANKEAQRQRLEKRYYDLMQREANAVTLTAEEEEMRAQRRMEAANAPQVYAPGMIPLAEGDGGATGTTTTSTAVKEDDQHTKDLKKRAVIALAVFLPIMVLMFVAFFLFIFVFSKGSNHGKAQNPSKSNKSSTNNSGTHNKTDRDNTTRDDSTGAGSRTRNQISTTM